MSYSKVPSVPEGPTGAGIVAGVANTPGMVLAVKFIGTPPESTWTSGGVDVFTLSPTDTVYVTLDGVTVNTGSVSQITSVTGMSAGKGEYGDVILTLPV